MYVQTSQVASLVGDDILRILGRGLMDADRFYFESSGRDDAI